LTISKQLTTLMNGDIFVKSTLGKGTTFSVLLPLKEAASQENVKKDFLMEAQLEKTLKGIHILLVEDNEFNRMVAEDTLKDAIENVKIEMAYNGKEAVDKISRHHYDVAIMDIQMPVMDGVEATKAIRKLASPHKNIPIIAMTANVLQEDIQRYLNAGMNVHVAKPFNKNELLHKLAAVLSHKEVKNNTDS